MTGTVSRLSTAWTSIMTAVFPSKSSATGGRKDTLSVAENPLMAMKSPTTALSKRVYCYTMNLVRKERRRICPSYVRELSAFAIMLGISILMFFCSPMLVGSDVLNATK